MARTQLNFSAFPPAQRSSFWKIVGLVVVGLVGLFGIELLIGSAKIAEFIVAITILILVVRVWRKSHDKMQATIDTLRKFASDNKFTFIEYAPETIVPVEFYESIASRNTPSTVFISYMMSGVLSGVNFRYYRLNFEQVITPRMRALAYDFSSNGRPMAYLTCLAIDRPIRRHIPWSWGGVQAVSKPNGYVYCEGQVSDRQTLEKIFRYAEDA